MKRSNMVFFLFVIAIVAKGVCADDEALPQAQNPQMDINKILEEETKKLFAVVKDETAKMQVRYDAVSSLGIMRSVSATPVLYEYLIEIETEFNTESTLETDYPCSIALIAIGKSASLQGVRELTRENSDLRRSLIVSVIRGVEGEAVGQFMLQQAVAAETSAEKKANLQKSLKEFEDTMMWETKEKAAKSKK